MYKIELVCEVIRDLVWRSSDGWSGERYFAIDSGALEDYLLEQIAELGEEYLTSSKEIRRLIPIRPHDRMGDFAAQPLLPTKVQRGLHGLFVTVTYYLIEPADLPPPA